MRGFLVGNGVFDWEDAAATHVPFAYGHGFLSTAVHNSILKTCAGNYVNPTTECKKLLEQIDANMVDVNGYDAYRTCYHPPGSHLSSPHPWHLNGLLGMTVADRSLVHAWARDVFSVSTKRRVHAQGARIHTHTHTHAYTHTRARTHTHTHTHTHAHARTHARAHTHTRTHTQTTGTRQRGTATEAWWWISGAPPTAKSTRPHISTGPLVT